MKRPLSIFAFAVIAAVQLYAESPRSVLHQLVTRGVRLWNAHSYLELAPMLATHGRPTSADECKSALSELRLVQIERYRVISGRPRLATEIEGRLVSIVPLLVVIEVDEARVAYPLYLYAYSTNAGKDWLFEILRNESQTGFDIHHPELKGKLTIPPVSSGMLIPKAVDLETVVPEEPNQSPEPTGMLVTPRAGARVAPSTPVAHL